MKPMSLYMDLGPVFDTQQILEAFYFALIVSYNIARAILVYIFISYTLFEQRFINNIFSKFFEPNYDLIVNSINNKYIYLDAIPIDITGIIDSMNVKVFGKDTVNITGLVEVDEATLFHEFISEDIGETLISSDGVVMSYSLNVPIKDEGKFQKKKNII